MADEDNQSGMMMPLIGLVGVVAVGFVIIVVCCCCGGGPPEITVKRAKVYRYEVPASMAEPGSIQAAIENSSLKKAMDMDVMTTIYTKFDKMLDDVYHRSDATGIRVALMTQYADALMVANVKQALAIGDKIAHQLQDYATVVDEVKEQQAAAFGMSYEQQEAALQKTKTGASDFHDKKANDAGFRKDNDMTPREIEMGQERKVARTGDPEAEKASHIYHTLIRMRSGSGSAHTADSNPEQKQSLKGEIKEDNGNCHPKQADGKENSLVAGIKINADLVAAKMMITQDKPSDEAAVQAMKDNQSRAINKMNERLKKVHKAHQVTITARLLALNYSFALKHFIMHNAQDQSTKHEAASHGRYGKAVGGGAVKHAAPALNIALTETFQKASATFGFPAIREAEVSRKSEYIEAMTTNKGILTGLLPEGLDEQDVYIQVRCKNEPHATEYEEVFSHTHPAARRHIDHAAWNEKYAPFARRMWQLATDEGEKGVQPPSSDMDKKIQTGYVDGDLNMAMYFAQDNAFSGNAAVGFAGGLVDDLHLMANGMIDWTYELQSLLAEDLQSADSRDSVKGIVALFLLQNTEDADPLTAYDIMDYFAPTLSKLVTLDIIRQFIKGSYFRTLTGLTKDIEHAVLVPERQTAVSGQWLTGRSGPLLPYLVDELTQLDQATGEGDGQDVQKENQVQGAEQKALHDEYIAKMDAARKAGDEKTAKIYSDKAEAIEEGEKNVNNYMQRAHHKNYDLNQVAKKWLGALNAPVSHAPVMDTNNLLRMLVLRATIGNEEKSVTGTKSDYKTDDGKARFFGVIGQVESAMKRANRGHYYGPMANAVNNFVNDFDIVRCSERVLRTPPEDHWFKHEYEHLESYFHDPRFPPVKNLRNDMLLMLNVPGKVVAYDASDSLATLTMAEETAAAENEAAERQLAADEAQREAEEEAQKQKEMEEAKAIASGANKEDA